MTKIVGWSEIDGLVFRPPPHVVKEEGEVLEFHDMPQMYGLETGDLIQYKTGLGIVTFRVAEVRPADLKDYPPELNLVTARKKES